MRKVIVYEWMSLDGVVQGPSTADEDPSGGFEHGGWHLRYFDGMSRNSVAENLARAASCSDGAPTSSSRRTGRTQATRSRSSPSR
jgi:hypothetical protein